MDPTVAATDPLAATTIEAASLTAKATVSAGWIQRGAVLGAIADGTLAYFGAVRQVRLQERAQSLHHATSGRAQARDGRFLRPRDRARSWIRTRLFQGRVGHIRKRAGCLRAPTRKMTVDRSFRTGIDGRQGPGITAALGSSHAGGLEPGPGCHKRDPATETGRCKTKREINLWPIIAL